jgi:two-component sensor histidine kinase
MRASGFFRILVSTLAFIASTSCLRAQCDTIRLAREVKNIEALTWSDYPKALALARTMTARYAGSAGWCHARALVALGKVHWTNGDYPLALSTLAIAEAEAQRSFDRESQARAYHVSANCYYYQGYYDSAEANFLRCHRIFEQMNHATGQIEVLHDMALMFHRQGNFARSLRYLLELEQLKEAAPDFIHYVGNFTGINNYFIDTLYYRDVIADEARLWEKFRDEGNEVGVYQSLINMSVARSELGEHRRAAYLAARGSEVMSSMGYYPFWYLAAKEYGLAGIRDSCFYYHRLALREFRRATRIKVVTTYELIAQSYKLFHQPDSAFKYYSLAFNLNQEMNNRLTIAMLHGELAAVSAELGQRERAEQHLVAGVELARKVSVKHTSALYAFGRDFYEKENPGRALAYARLHQKLVDSINRNENALELIRHQVSLETSRKERELEATRLKLRNRTVTLISFVVLSTVSLGFLVILYYQRRRIKMQNIQLNALNQEQLAMVQEVHHRVKNNLQYIISLLNLQANTAQNSELAAQIEEIKNRIMTMGVIHQKLYQAQGIHRVEVGPFLQELISNVLNASPYPVPIDRELKVDSFQLDADTAIAMGLLINELMTNAIKHAFAQHPAPKVELSLTREEAGLLLRIRDNGPGFRFPGNGGGFGMRLIQLFLRRLKGRVDQPDPNTVVISMDILPD